MKTIINDLDKLNKGNFSKLSLKVQDDKYRVRVAGEDKDYEVDSDIIPFYDTIKDLNSDEKIIEIIKYYLDNHTIISINDVGEAYYNSGEYCIASSYNSILAIKKDFPPRLNHVILGDLIGEKYKIDREKFLVMNFCNKNVLIKNSNTKTSSYKINEYGFIELNVVLKNEKRFITNFLYEKLEDNGNYKAHIEPNFVYNSSLNQYVLLGNKIVSEDLSIGFDEDFKYIVEEVVNTYNMQFENSKKLQLKKEGF